MRDFIILNSREGRQVLSIAQQQWGATLELEHTFLQNKMDLYLISRDIGQLDLSKLRINSLGNYFGELKNGQLRLSIEGSQIVGPKATRNIVELDTSEALSWLAGADLAKETGLNDFVIIKSGNDFLGTGRAKDGRILNFVPKSRRVEGW